MPGLCLKLHFCFCGQNGTAGIAAKKTFFSKQWSFAFLKTWWSLGGNIIFIMCSTHGLQRRHSLFLLAECLLVSSEQYAQIKNLPKKWKWRSRETWLDFGGEEDFDEKHKKRKQELSRLKRRNVSGNVNNKLTAEMTQMDCAKWNTRKAEIQQSLPH